MGAIPRDLERLFWKNVQGLTFEFIRTMRAVQSEFL